jgi:hypothetical protein
MRMLPASWPTWKRIPLADAFRKLQDPTFDGASRYAQIIADKKPPAHGASNISASTRCANAEDGIGLMDRDTGRAFGDPVAVYAYRTAEGAVNYYEARFIVAGKKEPRCWSWGRRGAAPEKWECAFPIGIRTMYGLDQVVAAPESQIILCEGPRKAEAAKTFFAALPCIGYAGGCQSWKKTDWSPVAGRRIIMWPDADDKGRQSFAALAQHLVIARLSGLDAGYVRQGGRMGRCRRYRGRLHADQMIMAWAKAKQGREDCCRCCGA